VLGLAKAGRAEYRVTGDCDLLAVKRFGHCRMVTPREFWWLMRQAE
jgi:predicted nucleic acid-binding protein